jgi:phospholipid-binding lipoprotein MlaA
MKLIEAIRRALAVAAVLGVAGCATAEPGAPMSATDPEEGFNRAMLDANIGLDRYALRPAAQAYDAVTPATIKLLIGNGFNHLELPSDFINYVLQGEPKLALHVLGRFTLNTVFGAAGLLDPATEFGLPEIDTDFGITLGKHGVPEGNYWVVPLIGPTTSRDITSLPFDILVSPTRWVGFLEPASSFEASAGLFAVNTIDKRDRNKAVIDELLYESEDPYVTLRSVYLQRRRSQIAGEDAAADALPDIFESK